MNGGQDVEGVTGALGSVRQLEEAIEASSVARETAEARLQAARAEASGLLAAAREDAAEAAAARRRGVLAAAETTRPRSIQEGEERAARFQDGGPEHRDAVVDSALAFILPAGEESEA